MRVLVTGGTGLLGNTVCRQLRERGHSVLALVRSEPDPEVFEGLDVELLHCPLVASAENQEPDRALEDGVQSCDAVIHSAAMIHLGWRRVEESMRVNRDGTKRLAAACLEHGKKLVHIGTVNTLAVGGRRTFADEQTPLDHLGGQIPCAYVQSKRASVTEVKSAVAAGLNAVILHPGFMLGPWDWKPSSGRMMWEVAKSWKPLSPSGGCSVCDSRDVAAGTLNALERDVKPGREFILAGHNWTYQQLWTAMAKRMGVRGPLRSAGPGIQFLTGLAGDTWTRLSGTEPDFNSAGVQMSAQFHWYDSNRAIHELGYRIRDAQESLNDAGEWIQHRFVLPERESGG
ncbi:MAG: NAD-dependent epimerase/dehydratase family protein [Planctomycetota bacterium]